MMVAGRQLLSDIFSEINNSVSPLGAEFLFLDSLLSVSDSRPPTDPAKVLWQQVSRGLACLLSDPSGQSSGLWV